MMVLCMDMYWTCSVKTLLAGDKTVATELPPLGVAVCSVTLLPCRCLEPCVTSAFCSKNLCVLVVIVLGEGEGEGQSSG